MAFTEDFSEFLDTDDFAVSATFTPVVGDPSTITGIFDAEYFEIDGDSVGVAGSQPMFLCKTADVAAAKFGDALTVNAVNYKIVNIQPDGTGLTMLILEQ